VKKLMAVLTILVSCVGISHADHLFGINAANITRGTLANERLDPSFTSNIEGIANSAKTYSLVIGTSSTNAGVVVQNTDQFNMALASLSARGLTHSATAQGTIFIRPGVYNIVNATIPAGIVVEGVPGSSVVFVTDNINASMVTIYGILKGITFNLHDQVFTSRLINITTGATLSDCRITGIKNQPNGASTVISAIGIGSATVTNVKNITFDDPTDPNDYTNGGVIHVRNSQNIVFDNIFVSSFNRVNDNGAFFSTIKSSNITFQNSTFLQTASFPININAGSVDIKILRNRFFVNNIQPSGVIVLQTNVDPTAFISTTVWINDNEFYVNASGTNPLIRAANTSIYGLHIQGNYAKALVGAGIHPFCTIAGASVIKAVLQDNNVDGLTFISDSGTSTQYTTRGNHVDGVQQ
jgi:hypothetical protein